MKEKNRIEIIVARCLIAALFLVAGVRKLLSWEVTLGYFGVLGMPIPEIMLPLTVLVEIGGGIALISGWRLREVSVVLGCFTLATAFSAHRFWMADAAQFNNQLNHFLKNVALFGGFLLLFAHARRTFSTKAALS